MAAASFSKNLLRRTGYVAAAAVPAMYAWQQQQQSGTARMHASTLIRTESNRVAHPGSDAPDQSSTSQQNGLKAESRRSTGSEGAVSARKEEVEVEVDRILERRVQRLPDSVYESVEIEADPSCPLCRFMRASPCGPHWSMWERCVKYHKDRKEDFTDYCGKYTLELAECVTREREQYPPPLLRSLGVPAEGEEEMWEDESGHTQPMHQTQQTQGSEEPVNETRHEVVSHEGQGGAGLVGRMSGATTMAASVVREEGQGEEQK